MIGWVGWADGSMRAEVADDGRTITVFASGKKNLSLSRHYTELLRDAYQGPQDGHPGRVRLYAMAAEVDGVAEYTGPLFVFRADIVY
jgi:hypothetical protein